VACITIARIDAAYYYPLRIILSRRRSADWRAMAARPVKTRKATRKTAVLDSAVAQGTDGAFEPAKLDLDELIGHIGDTKLHRLAKRAASFVSTSASGTCELVVDGTRYIVAYRLDSTRSQVQILRILHTSRMWPESL
jgi:hypothetical protein